MATARKKTTSTTTKKTTTTSKTIAVEPEVIESNTTTDDAFVKKEPRQYAQNDLILCRSVTAGWLGVTGKSGQYYIFENAGDFCEIEYQDLFALKSRRSAFLYDPCFVIEDEELLEHPRWADLAKFYEEEVFSKEDVDQVLNLPNNAFEETIKKLPKGLAKTLQVRVATKIEDGTFDSLGKIKAIDETFGTDFMSIIAE